MKKAEKILRERRRKKFLYEGRRKKFICKKKKKNNLAFAKKKFGCEETRNSHLKKKIPILKKKKEIRT